MTWYVYILECVDSTFYTGITNDLDRRVLEHNESKVGAKYTRARRPVRLVYTLECEDKPGALKEEYRIKSLTKKEKRDLIEKS